MYKENEVVVTTEDIGSEEKGNLVPKGTKATFLKAVDADDLSKCLVAIQIGDRILVTLETNIKIKNWWRRRKAFKQFNNQMMLNNPRYRRYHPSLPLRLYFRLYYYIADKFGGKGV